MELVLYFFVYAFIGWMIEVIYQAYKHHRFINRGFLNGPFLPIYGLSAVFLHVSVRWLAPEFALQNPLHVLALFAFVTILTTLAELFGGALLYHLFEARWWDYSHMKYNYKGFVCLRFSLIWGIMGMMIYSVFHIPFLVPYIQAINQEIMRSLTIPLLIILVVDYAFTIIALIDFRRLLRELKTRTDRFNLTTKQGLKNGQTKNTLVERAKKLAHTIGKQGTIQHIRQMVDQIKSLSGEVKKERTKKDFDAVRNTLQKITGSRFYKAFPKMRIALKNRQNKTEKHDD